jgi:hypothetical protein
VTDTLPRTTRAGRMAMPLARQVVKDLAVEHGACIRPIQLRRTSTDTGQVDTVLVPCGHTLASGLPCMRRTCPDPARRPMPGRVAPRGRTRPDSGQGHRPPAALGGLRAEAQQMRDPAATAGRNTTDLNELIRELDAEITKAGVRGKVRTGANDAAAPLNQATAGCPDLPKRKVSARTVGKTYTAPDAKTFRPSLFVTLTCPSYGRVRDDGTPAGPASYDYAAPHGMRWLSPRCSTGSSRTCAATSATPSSTSPPSNPSAGWPRTSTWPSAAPRDTSSRRPWCWRWRTGCAAVRNW